VVSWFMVSLLRLDGPFQGVGLKTPGALPA
jgi:hypothetical protein